MKRLHFRDDAELAQTFEVCRREHLRMDQTKPPIAFAVLLVEFFEIVEQHVVGFVTDRVNGELQAGAICIEHVAEKLSFDELAFVVHHQRPPASAIVRVV